MSDLYEQDFHAWSQRQAALLREGRTAELDSSHLAEEVESLGRGERRELVNRLAVLLTHLLKWQFQPERRSRSWTLTLAEQRRRLDRHLRDNPSLRPLLPDAIADAYGDALIQAERETGLDLGTFPAACPFTSSEILTGPP